MRIQLPSAFESKFAVTQSEGNWFHHVHGLQAAANGEIQ